MDDHYDKTWQVKYDDSEEKIIIYVKHPPKFGGICPLAELSCGGPDDVGYENDMKRAKWMAAAPDLLDALERIKENSYPGLAVKESTSLNRIYKEATQAIAKAE